MNPRFAMTTILASLTFGAAALLGCSSSSEGATPAPTYSCSTKGPCPDDPVPTASEAASCESLGSDATCGAAFQSYASCAFSAAICTDAGVSDPTGDSISAACSSQYSTYSTCLENKINDAGSGD